MRQFAAKLCTVLDLTEITVFGEVFRHKSQQFASYHPFGYKVNNKYYGLTQQCRDIFLECMSEEDTQEFSKLTEHKTFIETLQVTNRHVVCPPIIFYKTCTLAEGIQELHDMMKQPSSHMFEGMFCVCEDEGVSLLHSNCNLAAFKWKTGNFEEQSRMPPLESLNLSEPDHVVLYNKLAEVFNSKPFASMASFHRPSSPSSTTNGVIS